MHRPRELLCPPCLPRTRGAPGHTDGAEGCRGQQHPDTIAVGPLGWGCCLRSLLVDIQHHSRVFPGAGAPRGVAQPPALHFAVSHRAGRAGCPMLSPYASPWTASRIPHPTLISARALAVPSVPGLPAGLLWGQHSLLSLSLYTPVIFNSAYANPKSGMSSGPGPRGNGHGANFLPFLPLFLYNTQQRFSSAA